MRFKPRLEIIAEPVLVKNYLLWCDPSMGARFMKSPVVKHSVNLNGRKTSVSVEDAFWEGLKEVAGKRLMTVADLIANIDATRQQTTLSSADGPAIAHDNIRGPTYFH